MAGRRRYTNKLARQGVERWHGKPPIPGKEPFPKSNTLALLHGLYSKRVRGPLEEGFAESLREAMSDGLGHAYNPTLDEHAVRRAARCLATIEIVEGQMDLKGADAMPERSLYLYEKAISTLERWLGELGMTPAARARLGVDVARATDIVAALHERGRELKDKA